MANIKKGDLQLYVRDLITEALSPNGNEERPLSDEQKAAEDVRGHNQADPGEQG